MINVFLQFYFKIARTIKSFYYLICSLNYKLVCLDLEIFSYKYIFGGLDCQCIIYHLNNKLVCSHLEILSYKYILLGLDCLSSYCI